MIPDTFWVWGTHARRALNDRNQFGDRGLVGGNAWLNAWRQRQLSDDFMRELEHAQRLSSAASKTVLFTVQQGIDLTPAFAAIEQAPKDWTWLVRVHRRMRTPEVVAEFHTRASKARAKVVIDEASSGPLYPLLMSCDVHVTSFSTCAIEALAFGKPTVTFGTNARAAFGPLLESSAMTHVEDASGMLGAIDRFAGFTPVEATTLAEPNYANVGTTVNAVASLWTRVSR